MTSSRTELIDNLKKKMDQNNTTNYMSIENLRSDAEDMKALYNINNDKNIEIDDTLEENLKLNIANQDQSKKTYIKELKQVIENSDVILEVLDIRDPLNCRSIELEKQILSHKDEKKIILILNKMDLVPL